MPKVSIIVISYNGGELLDRTLSNIEDIKFNDVEVICVDNSEENEIKGIVSKYKDIIYVKSPFLRSKNKSVNYGVNLSHGDYLLLLDDDIIIKDSAELFTNLFSIYKPNVGIISLALVDQGMQVSGFYGGFLGYNFIRKNKLLSLERIEKLNGRDISFPNGGAIFIKKDIWTQLGGYDESYTFGGDDTDLGIRCWLAGLRCILFSTTIQEHIGLVRRKDNEYYAKSYGMKTYAQLSVIFKSYKNSTMWFVLTSFLIYQIVKAIKQSLQRKDGSVLKECISGVKKFIKEKDTLVKERKKRQTLNLLNKDVFIIKSHDL